MKYIILPMVLSMFLWAESLALFASVVDVAENDILNVRKSPHYKSEKVGMLPNGAYIGIENCKKVDHRSWCRVYPLVQQWYEDFGNDSHIGWVNARYLKFSNCGYVVRHSKKNCDYSIGCKNGKCEVVYDYITDNEHNIIALRTKWIERKYLKGESQFGVTPDNANGFCNSRMYIEAYLKN